MTILNCEVISLSCQPTVAVSPCHNNGYLGLEWHHSHSHKLETIEPPPPTMEPDYGILITTAKDGFQKENRVNLI